MAETPGTVSHNLSEDDIYRTSSQYRIWSFSPERLATLRRTTHELAIERINAQRSNVANGNVKAYLSESEELLLVQRYCEQIRTTSDHFKWPANVKATAVQYLRRFYVSNSVMTYPPKEIYKTALFLACKTEATHMTLSEYARRISSKPDEILAPEYKLMQALRFTLDVRQPFRGLKGILMEMLNMVDGLPERKLKDEILAIDTPGESARTAWRAPRHGNDQIRDTQDRIQAAYIAARAVLDNEALMTDVYFLFTPPQILFAALVVADPALTDFYLATKIPGDATLQSKIMTTIRTCVSLLATASSSSVLTKDERAAMEAKLEQCRDPSTRDLVKAHMAKKAGDDPDDEKAKRRRAERERHEQEGHDLFGPALSRNGTKDGG